MKVSFLFTIILDMFIHNPWKKKKILFNLAYNLDSSDIYGIKSYLCSYNTTNSPFIDSLLPESESEYFTGDTSIDIHSPGPMIAKTSI